MRKIWDFHGGVHPPENKVQSTHTPIATIPLASKIILPLNQHIGAPASPIVNVGDNVLKGQKIADAQGVFSAPVHASTSGIISAIATHPIPHPSGMESECISIEPDGKDQWINLSENENYLALERLELLETIREAGIAGMGGAGFPSAVKLNPPSTVDIDTLILNGTECEPYITADDMLMRERAEEIVRGAELLAYLLKDPAHILIGIEDNKPEAISAMQSACEHSAAEVVVFPTKYPSGGEKQLIQILTGKEVPSGGLPAEIGIVVQNIGTALAAYRAVRYGEPLISRITTVVGQSLDIQRNIEVPLGTPIDHILVEHGFNEDKRSRLIIGGPMMGFAAEQETIPVIKTTNCVLVPSTSEMPEQPPPAQPCIRCGMCSEACPASLLPQQLFWYSQAEDFDKLESHSLFDCIECGACSYICPSNIPLVQYYRHSKATMKHLEKEKEKSDRSRLRFEQRKARLEKAEAEKEAKRLARKKAAEEAKRQAAQNQTRTEQKTNPAAPDQVTNSTKGATLVNGEEKDTALESVAKLERSLSSATSRFERAEKALGEAKKTGEEQARIDTLTARVKQAEQKLNDAKAKLADYQSSEKTINKVGENAKEKIELSSTEKQQKNIDTLKKRIEVAQQKLAEAEQNNSPSTDALKKGVEKLQQKLDEALKDNSTSNIELNGPKSSDDSITSLSAADQAIEKAKKKAAEQALMNPMKKNGNIKKNR